MAKGEPLAGGSWPGRPTQEEIEAKRAARAVKRTAEQALQAAKEETLRAALLGQGPDDGPELLSKDESGRQLFFPRRWSHTGPEESKGGIRILSWNMLAQGLVRRKLFPGSDCLKMADRSPGLSAELLAHRFDIGCFQEVDRTDIHFATLEKGKFAYVYEKGYSVKQHGLMISWRTVPRRLRTSPSPQAEHEASGWSSSFEREPLATKIAFLDDLDVTPYLSSTSRAKRETLGPHARRAGSRQTRNIALFVALRVAAGAGSHPEQGEASQIRAGGGCRGVIVATTHLFWHPMHAYERVRQAGLVLRELDAFRKSQPEWQGWPVILAGDFNDQPHSATYHFLTGSKLTSHCETEITASSVIHQTIDARAEREATDIEHAGIKQTNAPVSTPDGHEEGEGGEAADEEEAGADDQVRKNCRTALQKDGLLCLEEFHELYGVNGPRALSTYGVYNQDTGNFFGTPGRGRERWDEHWTPETPNLHEGPSREPMWTIFSSLFSLTLDYIFLLPTSRVDGKAPEMYPRVLSLLPTHRTHVLQPGIPRKSVCCSDHIAIGAEIDPQDYLMKAQVAGTKSGQP
ncbi:Endonuclease/exonuclease/phosphatase [Tilletiaria anomala UBC 951]|uniref:Endonuclease/exonuclease/phosphatase n=1 Tax=Tilletiaria anomala (strain ATCC 24038 / CBS 436.72 / UBC 951) TaxID=1037660 RepID=A0A066V601_TILAU|nr:Endonuclease/exonuclease/phosphatase [Tilletiaria anomala UBC 951]KDN35683.1 Endonuclease/exonuclease/phosphatase [Tilletiaria anomala UBC 951]